MGKSVTDAMKLEDTFSERELSGLFGGRKSQSVSKPVSNVKARKTHDLSKVSSGALCVALSVRIGRFLGRHATDIQVMGFWLLLVLVVWNKLT